MQYDVIIIGGGIVGLATGYQLLRERPGTSLAVLEKEPQVAMHQTGRNSGVLHSGIYYKPGSLKAINCREGKRRMEEFCAEQGVPYEICGKVIVATGDEDLPAMQRVFQRGQQNGVTCELIDATRLAELEPHSAGVAAIHVPEAGIVDYAAVSRRLAELIAQAGGQVVTSAKVTRLIGDAGEMVIESTAGEFHARQVVNCAGLYSDRVAKLAGAKPRAKILPFRGEYYELKADAAHLCRNLIYPVPDPRFPFLGVHFTRMVHGGVECGPNAVLALAREGYRWRNVNLRDLAEAVTYPGFLRLMTKYWRTGFGEVWRSLNKQAFVRALQRLVPEITADQLVPCPSGVRAQAILPDGAMVDDFQIVEEPRVVNVLNAPSPAATSSLNIGKQIAEIVLPRLD